MQRRKRLVIVTQSMTGWGVERNLLSIVKNVDSELFEPMCVVTAPVENGNQYPFKVVNINVPRVRPNSYTQPIIFLLKWFYLSAWFLRDGKKTDIVVTSLLDETVCIYLIKKLLRRSFHFVSFNQIRITESTRKTNLFTSMLIKLLIAANRNADTILSLSKGVAEDLSESFGVQKEIFIHTGCINADEIVSAREEPIEEEWLLKDPRKTIIYAGRLVNEQKRVDVFVKSIRTLLEKHPELQVKAVIIGEGRDRQKLIDQVKEFHLQETIYFLNFKPNIFKYFSAADCMVLTSEYEGFANVLIEAMSTGLPVISTDCPSGPAEILENGKWGFLVPRGDFEKISEYLFAILTNSQIASEMKAKSLKRAKDYECKLVFEKLSQFLASRVLSLN